MTQTSHLKAAQITAVDTFQPVGDVQSAGFGAQGRLKNATAFVNTVSGDLTGSTYQLIRVPSFACIKRVLIAWDAMGAGDLDISVYYSDSKIDGTAFANQGLVVPTTGSVFFMDGQDLTSASGWVDKTFANAANSGSYDPSMINKRLWDALGLTSDPGGMFDIVGVIGATTVTTGAALAMSVDFTE
jgi:hypothetical protein